MNVLHINTKYQGGGAARAMGRLHHQLIQKGHQSKFLVGRPQGADQPDVAYVHDLVSPHKKWWESVLSRFGNRYQHLWGIHPWSHYPTLHIPETELFDWADLIDLRNLFGYYINLRVLARMSGRKPLVWRLPDMWALTGHCAYPYQCPRWVTGCFDCPLLSERGREWVEPTPPRWDGTRGSWRAKHKIYQGSEIHVVVTTQWMKDNVEKSILNNALSLSVISNGVDLQVYRPQDKISAREALGLPTRGNLVLFAAANLDNRRKGFQFAVRALRNLHKKTKDSYVLITMGNPGRAEDDQVDMPVHHLGFIRDPQLQSQIFSAADVFICPTLADAQPQTALESIACGTPVIAFPVGPMPEIVLPGKTGFLAEEVTIEALEEVVKQAFQDPEMLKSLEKSCRIRAEDDYDLDRQTNQYILLYKQILQKENPSF